MLGGPSSLLENWHPLFASMGTHIHHLGELGAGMSVKVLNNYVASSSVVIVRRVLDACQALNVSPEKLLQIMSESPVEPGMETNSMKSIGPEKDTLRKIRLGSWKKM